MNKFIQLLLYVFRLGADLVQVVYRLSALRFDLSRV